MEILLSVALVLSMGSAAVLAFNFHEQAAFVMLIVGLGCAAILLGFTFWREWNRHGWIGILRLIVGAVLYVIGMGIMLIIAIIRGRDPKVSHIALKNVVQEAILDSWFPLPPDRTRPD